MPVASKKSDQPRVIQAGCKCGEPVLIELQAAVSARTDRKRPHYVDSHPEGTVFRCRRCRGWLGHTCKEAEFD